MVRRHPRGPRRYRLQAGIGKSWGHGAKCVPCDAQSAHDRQVRAPYAVPHRRERPGKASCGPIDTSHGCVRAVRMGIIHRRDECSPDLPMWDDGRVVPAGSPCPVFVHLDDNDLVSLDSAFVFVQVDDIALDDPRRRS